MPVEIRVPQLGESVVEATVGKWLKQKGEQIVEGEPVVELETEKVSVEVAAGAAGVLAAVEQQEGSTVRVGEVLGRIEEGAKAAADAPEPERQAAAAPAPHPTSPSVRRMAEEHGVALQDVQGTGPGGRVTRDDIRSYLEQRTQPAVPPPAPPTAQAAAPAPSAPAAERREERVRMSRRRLTIARRLVEAQQTAAMLTTFNEVDMSAVMELRRRRREAFQQRHGVGLGFMSFFTKAAVGALKAFPRLNAELQGEDLVLKRYYDIGVAVDTEGGLVVPVLRDADGKNFVEVEREIVDLANRARENKLTLADLQGGTFTITNGGVFGSLLSTPILNTPQVGILGMHRIQERPVAVGGQVEIRPLMYLALSYDHRVVDGREAVLFLVRIKELIEDPEVLLLEG